MQNPFSFAFGVICLRGTVLMSIGVSLFAQAPDSYAIRTVVGNGLKNADASKDRDSVPALEANVIEPAGLAVDSRGRVFFTDRYLVRMYDPATGLVARVAGQFPAVQAATAFGGDGGPALQARFAYATGLAFDKESRLVVADTLNHRIRRISSPGTPTATIETIAGNGTATDTGDGGPVASATFRSPNHIAYAADGALFVTGVTGFSYRLRTIEPNGVMGPGWGPGINICSNEVPVCTVSALAGDAAGNVVVGDVNQVSTISPQRKFSVLAGKERYGSGAFAGDGGAATLASFWGIGGVAIDTQRNTFVSDFSNQRIRRITPDGIIRTIAGTGKGGTVGTFGGDDGPALEADLAGPTHIAAESQGKVYFIDSGSNRIRVLVPCALELKSDTPTFDSLGGEGELNVVLNERGCRWTATSDSSWLTLTSAAAGLGSGKLGIKLTANPANTARSATIRVGSKSISITQLAAGSVFPRLSSATHAASFSAGISPGAWVVLTGTNLSATTRTWGDNDIQGNRLPTSLDGVSVKIGGRDSYVYFVSPGQLNVLAPSGLANGPQSVEITNRIGKGVFTATAKSVDPAFFLVTAPRNGLALPAAVHADGVLVGEPGAIPGAATRPALAGEAITIYGTGFGVASPSLADGLIGLPASALANELTVFIGGQKAPVDYAGMVGPGLVQVNLRIPDGLPAGRHSLVAAIGGAESPENAAIVVE